MWAHRRQLANTIELVLPSAHPGPQPKRQIDPFSRFCTAHSRKSLYFTMGNPFPKIAPSNRGIWTHVTHYSLDSLGPSKPIIQTVSRSVRPFWHRWPQSVPILYSGTPFPLKIAPSHGGSGPQLVHSCLSPPESSTQTAFRSVQTFLQGSRSCQTDRPTDRQTRLHSLQQWVASAYAALRCGLMTIIIYSTLNVWLAVNSASNKCTGVET